MAPLQTKLKKAEEELKTKDIQLQAAEGDRSAEAELKQSILDLKKLNLKKDEEIRNKEKEIEKEKESNQMLGQCVKDAEEKYTVLGNKIAASDFSAVSKLLGLPADTFKSQQWPNPDNPNPGSIVQGVPMTPQQSVTAMQTPREHICTESGQEFHTYDENGKLTPMSKMKGEDFHDTHEVPVVISSGGEEKSKDKGLRGELTVRNNSLVLVFT